MNEDGYIVHDVNYIDEDEMLAPSDSEGSLPPFPNMREVPPIDIQLEIPQFESLEDYCNDDLFDNEDEPLMKREFVNGIDGIKIEGKERGKEEGEEEEEEEGKATTTEGKTIRLVSTSFAFCGDVSNSTSAMSTLNNILSQRKPQFANFLPDFAPCCGFSLSF